MGNGVSIYSVCQSTSRSYSEQDVVPITRVTGHIALDAMADKQRTSGRFVEVSTISTKTCLITKTNNVAPVIIRNCKEEFQRVCDLKDPIVYGHVTEGGLEHPLLQGKYFVVKDVLSHVDRKGTLNEHLAPNLCHVAGSMNIYGMGQPTKNGITNLIQKLDNEGQHVLMFCVRDEPVLFLHRENDFVPYSTRTLETIHDSASPQFRSAEQIDDHEAALQKEILDLASLTQDNMFYFYDKIDTFEEEPHLYPVRYPDDLMTTKEVYGRLTFAKPNIRYTHLCFPVNGAPPEHEFDQIVNVYKDTLFHSDNESLAHVFMGNTGESRTTYAMVITSLILTRHQGLARNTLFDIQPSPTRSYEKNHFKAIEQLVQQFPDGILYEQEVDSMINHCSNLRNIHTEIFNCKRMVENIADDYIIEDQSSKLFLREKCRQLLEKYFYLICFNAYIHEQYPNMFYTKFSEWMNQHPVLYRLLAQLDISERETQPTLLKTCTRFLVADDYIGLDMLGSKLDVGVSNFRQLQGLPVYGMAQPSSTTLQAVCQYLTEGNGNKDPRQSSVIVINLREDLTIECDGVTYSWRELQCLEEPIIMPGIPGYEIEEKERLLQAYLLKIGPIQVYEETSKPRRMKKFTHIKTSLEMAADQANKTPEKFFYHRSPMLDDQAPNEKDFDTIMAIVKRTGIFETTNDLPAFAFHCRTGKGRTTTAMVTCGLILYNNLGFPYGTKPGEQERVSLPNAAYTKGEFTTVCKLIAILPNGHQVKREVDFVLDQCHETMTTMHYHIREEIFVTYKQMENMRNPEERLVKKKKSLDLLERYIYLILFNAYLHWRRKRDSDAVFSTWMRVVAPSAGVYNILDNLAFYEFAEACPLKTRRVRWTTQTSKVPFRGRFS